MFNGSGSSLIVLVIAIAAARYTKGLMPITCFGKDSEHISFHARGPRLGIVVFVYMLLTGHCLREK